MSKRRQVEEKKREELTGPCKDCPYAEWVDLDGAMYYGCDMSYCRMADDDIE